MRDKALGEVRLLPDPVDLALQYTPDLSATELAEVVEARRKAVAEQLVMFDQEFRATDPDLVGLEPMIFEHCLARLRAELSWHDDLLARQAILDHGVPPEMADAIMALRATALEGFTSVIHPDTEQVTGKPATSFREWAQRNIGNFP